MKQQTNDNLTNKIEIMQNVQNEKNGTEIKLNKGDICYVLDRQRNKITVEFSHVNDKGRAYAHTVDGNRKDIRRDLSKIWLIAEGNGKGSNEVAFEKIREMQEEKNVHAEKALEKMQEQNRVKDEAKRKRETKKASFSITKRFEILESLVYLTANAHRKALIITGEGGLGKTFTVMNVLDSMGLKQEIITEPVPVPTNEEIEGEIANGELSSDEIELIENETPAKIGKNIKTLVKKKGVVITLTSGVELKTKNGIEEDENGTICAEGETGDYIVIKGFSTAKGFYITLYEHRHKLVIFDDCDEVLENKIAKNILKAVLDSYERRFVSWMSAGSSGGAPKQYEFCGQIIFISNLPKEKMDKAVLTRCSKVDVSMTPDEKIERMETIIQSPKYMEKVPMHVKEESLKLISENRYAGEISMRTLEEVIIFRTERPDTWKDLAEYSMYS